MVLGALIAGGIGFLAGRLTAPKRDKHKHEHKQEVVHHQPTNLTPVTINHHYPSTVAHQQPASTWNYQPIHQTVHQYAAPQTNGGITVNIQNLLQIAQQTNGSNYGQSYQTAQAYSGPTNNYGYNYGQPAIHPGDYNADCETGYETDYEDIQENLDINWPPANSCHTERNYTAPLAINTGYSNTANAYARIYIS